MLNMEHLEYAVSFLKRLATHLAVVALLGPWGYSTDDLKPKEEDHSKVMVMLI